MWNMSYRLPTSCKKIEDNKLLMHANTHIKSSNFVCIGTLPGTGLTLDFRALSHVKSHNAKTNINRWFVSKVFY